MGPKSFISTFDELKPHFNFNLTLNHNNISTLPAKNFDGLIFYDEVTDNKDIKKTFQNSSFFKILATSQNLHSVSFFDNVLKLPVSIKEINSIVESTAAKKKFNENSTIKIKEYIMNKNEKKLIKEDKFIILTEKEIQLLELFKNKNKSVSKNNILSLVWKYSSEADTHTVETHIYRLRKKISEKFLDEKFILNNKEGYYL